MASLPALPLSAGAPTGQWEIADNDYERKKSGCEAFRCQIQAQLQIFHKAPTAKRHSAHDLPRNDHAGAHHLDWKAECPQSEWPDPVLHDPCKFGDLIIYRGVWWRLHQEASL